MSGFDVKFLSFLMAQSHQFSFEEEEEKRREAKGRGGEALPSSFFFVLWLEDEVF